MRQITLFLVAFLTWCVLNWMPDWQHLTVGFFVSLFVVFIVNDLFVTRLHVLKDWKRYFYFIFWYVPVLSWQIVKTNVDVAYRILHPKLPIHPGIVKVKASLKSDTGLTFLANSITLTPGTMVVDIDQPDGILYVHWINVKTQDVEAATKIVVERFEKILRRIFD